MTNTSEITLEFKPKSRFEMIPVRDRLAEEFGTLLSEFQQHIYYSYHTTAGYIDPLTATKLNHSPASMRAYVESFQKLFPPGAGYFHDRIDLRQELTASEKLIEPMNCDAHLTYIGCGLRNCVTYPNRGDMPVYFIELDGTSQGRSRHRRTTVVGYNHEEPAGICRLEVPVTSHSIDTVNLRSSELGLFETLNDELKRRGISHGRIDLRLDRDDKYAGLTVNEYETLLMNHDLHEVIRDPLRFMAEKGLHLFQRPGILMSKLRGYARYDLVRVIQKMVDELGLKESFLEDVIYSFMAYPASRRLSMKRSLSLLVTEKDGVGRIAQGRYQSPILIQWSRAAGDRRILNAFFTSFR